MLRAAALYYAIIVALLIAMMSGSLILLAHYNRFESTQFSIQRKLVSNARSGINLLIAEKDLESYRSPKLVDLFGDEADSVSLKGDYWGLFKMVSATSIFKQHRFNRSALIGWHSSKEEQPTLFLADRNRPLSLCGKTLIKGEAHLPKAGVKRAYIEGQSFTGEKLIAGTVRNSRKELPPFNEKLIDLNKELFSITPKTDSIILWEAPVFDISMNRSFQQSTVSVLPVGNLHITDEASLSGNIRILCNYNVSVSSNAQIEDILIYTGSLIVETGFRGTFQAFASDSIKIGSDCILEYPSVLCLFQFPGNETDPFLTIGEKTEFSGIVFSEGKRQRGAVLKIGKEAIITGDVYVTGSVELKGNIYGHLTCQKFYLKTPSSVYENHLLNAVIDRSAMPDEFVVSLLIPPSEEIQNGIVKWLE